MTVDMARAVADTVLFEGHLPHPYGSSAPKSRTRWQFGVLAPRTSGFCEPWYSHTECLLECGSESTVDVLVRLLQLRSRGKSSTPDEGVPREISVRTPLDGTHHEVPFLLPGGGNTEHDRRHYHRLSGLIRLDSHVTEPGSNLRKLRVTVENHTPWIRRPRAGRDERLRCSLVSAHSLLSVRGGGFVSLLEPPAEAEQAAENCRNEHTWPVLIGERGNRETMLSSPVILYDYPAVSEQSRGTPFDAAEIDGIRTLRTMTPTAEKKRKPRETGSCTAGTVAPEHVPAKFVERLHEEER